MGEATGPGASRSTAEGSGTGLARRLGPFDATMLVMGGIVGSGIFINPYLVARQAGTPLLVLGAWAAGGVLALAGAFIYAELAARRPEVGGQYAYLREAYHPLAAFVYGWALLLVTMTGGMAAVAVTFAAYFLELTGAPLSGTAVAALALAVLTAVNCLGVRAGGTVQSGLMVLRILALASLIAAGLFLAAPAAPAASPVPQRPPSLDLLSTLGAALVPVLFAYGGWQSASFVAGEVREPRRNLPRGLLFGVTGVVVLYLAVNFVALRVLGAGGLAATVTPASDVMRSALGEAGARWIAAGIAISTLGFLSQSMLTAPRVYFAMAADGLFFGSVAWLHPRTRVPVVAIALQGAWAVAIALSGRYEQILSYVVAVDWLFYGVTATCLFVFRRRDGAGPGGAYRVPGHPLTTAAFVLACAAIVLNTAYKYPTQSAIGLGILLAAVPVYFVWRARESRWARRAG